ncbi:MAG: hypothetical protein Q9222_007187 [Ikaeria aurantiellina]
MDPLSVSAAIIGLCTAAIQVNHLLKAFVDSSRHAPASARHTLTEVTAIYVCLNQLEAFLSGQQATSHSRRSMVMIEQIIVIFTDCVSIFSELEQVLDPIKTDGPTRTIDRAKWALKEKSIKKLLMRLQTCKASLSLMLAIFTCIEVEYQHVTTVEKYRKDAPGAQQVYFALTHDQHLELEESPVYKRIKLSGPQLSNSSSNVISGPSLLSGLSLSDVSNVTMMALPISRSELWNHQRYDSQTYRSTNKGASALDAWYYPPAKVQTLLHFNETNADIYTNQYAQAKFNGHLIYRRFAITGPDRPPRFKEGLAILSSAYRDFEGLAEEEGVEERAELEDTSRWAFTRYINTSNPPDHSLERRLETSSQPASTYFFTQVLSEYFPQKSKL